MKNYQDSICVSTKDDDKLAEFFSRREAGDQVKFSGVATLTENEDGIVMLAIDEISVSEGKKKKKASDGPEPTSVAVMKSRISDEETEAETE